MKIIASLGLAMLLPLALAATAQESGLNLYRQSSKIFDRRDQTLTISQSIPTVPAGETPPIMVVLPQDSRTNEQPVPRVQPDQQQNHPAKTLIWFPVIAGVGGALVGGLLAFAKAEIAYKAVALGLLGSVFGALLGIIVLMVKMFGADE